MPFELRLDMLGLRASLCTPDAEIAAVLRDVFGAFAVDVDGRGGLTLTAFRREQGFAVATGSDAVTDSGAATECATLSDLAYAVDKNLVLEVQRHRPDLLFVHAAVLEHEGRAILLAGDSGSGKSTTALGLTRLGFRLMSDELAPIDPRALTVEAYPRALGLKRVPPGQTIPMPARTLERTIHVPVTALGQVAVPPRSRLSRIFFVRHAPEARAPQLTPLSAAETAARLYVQCLNALAHPAAGLDAVADIAAGVPGYSFTTADLEASCRLVASELEPACGR
jgi:hypothetical protein